MRNKILKEKFKRKMTTSNKIDVEVGHKIPVTIFTLCLLTGEVNK